MKRLTKLGAVTAAVLFGGLLTVPPAALASKAPEKKALPGTMLITDEAGVFSAEAKKQAEQKMAAAKFDRGLHFNVDTFKSLPADVQKDYDSATDKGAVMKKWAKSVATGDRAKGPYVLICMKPGWTIVLADEESVNRGFSKTDEHEVMKIFDTALREAAKQDGEARSKTRDAALLAATEYIIKNLTDTKVVPVPPASKEKP